MHLNKVLKKRFVEEASQRNSLEQDSKDLSFKLNTIKRKKD